jgi:hypothetical protein
LARTCARTSVDLREATHRDRFLTCTPLYPRNLLFIKRLCTIQFSVRIILRPLILLLELIPNLPGYVVPAVLIPSRHGLAEPISKDDTGDDGAFAAVKQLGYPVGRWGIHVSVPSLRLGASLGCAGRMLGLSSSLAAPSSACPPLAFPFLAYPRR